jgi:hypothetical protein
MEENVWANDQNVMVDCLSDKVNNIDEYHSSQDNCSYNLLTHESTSSEQ